MTDLTDNAWHLAKNDEELKFVNFEFLFWRTYHSWIRWQEDCQSCFADDALTAAEIALLHIIRIKDRPKTIYEIGRLLNRDDTPNIQYGVKKLVDLGYVKRVDVKAGAKKAIAYQITDKGIKNTDTFTSVRNNVLLKVVNGYTESIKFEETAKTLAMMKGIYEEASRLVAFYKSDTKIVN